MAKRPSNGPPATPGVPAPIDAARIATAPTKLAAFAGFNPTDRQLEVRAAFWAVVRESPHLDPKKLNARQIQDLIPSDSTGLAGWWKDPDFRKWFLDGEEWKAQVELLLTLTLDQIKQGLRGGHFQAKDLIACLKTLAEVGDRLPKKWMKERFVDADVGQAEPAELRAIVAEEARRLGWTPPADWSDAGPAEPPVAPAEGEPEPETEEPGTLEAETEEP